MYLQTLCCLVTTNQQSQLLTVYVLPKEQNILTEINLPIADN